MIRQYKCNNCGHEFKADDTLLVTCPECQSDNVTILQTKKPILKYALIGILAIIVAAGIAFAIKYVKEHKGEEESGTENVVVVPEEPDPYTETDDTSTPAADYHEIEPISIENLKGDPKTETYSFTAITAATGTLKYYLTDNKTGDKKAYAAPGGQFTNVPPAGDGTYILTIEQYDGNTLVDKGEQVITGFDVFAKETKKLTVAEVQSYMNAMVANEISGLQKIKASGHFSKDVKLVADGRPCSWDNFGMELLNSGGSTAIVESVGYDSTNHVNRINIRFQ